MGEGRSGSTTRAGLTALAMCLLCGASSFAADTAAPREERVWRTFVLERPDQLRPPPPPANRRADEAGLAKVARRQHTLTPKEQESIRYWDEGAVTHRWVERLLRQIAARHMNPIRASRAIALMTVATYDAAVATLDAKLAYQVASVAERSQDVQALVRVPTGPSFPSEHAAVAAAAAAVLSYLFPSEQEDFTRKAQEAAESRTLAGMSSPTDVAAGLALGAAVGALVVERGQHDNSDADFTGTIPVGAGFWAPTFPFHLVEPAAGRWRPWVLQSGDEVPLPPPPVFGSVEYLTEVDEISGIVANLTADQKAVALYWADGMGTITPPGHWLQDASAVVDQRFRSDARQATRALALLGVSMADAFIACWYEKYTYWTVRPDQVINSSPFRDLDPLHPAWNVSPPIADRRSTFYTAFIRTPAFPGYPSGHATQSGAGAEVLAYVFPDLAKWFQSRAEEAALSRLYAGIHFSSDNLQGLAFGRAIGRRVIASARQNEPVGEPVGEPLPVGPSGEPVP